MAYRTFFDRNGAYWQVWDSQPSRAERRSGPTERRRSKGLSWKGPDRRMGADRRVTAQRRISLADGLGLGWLTFESLREKRRLNPIPPRWDTVSEDQLRALCEQARVISKLGDSSAA